jgi:hypothetical protein
MADKELEADDPMEFVGTAVPATEKSDEEMTRAVTEEFLLMGFDRDRLMRLFRDPFYAGTHRIFVERGEAFVEGVVDAVLSDWGLADEAAG